MDSLPDLHPIVLQHISSPPFEYSPQGLTFKSHRREAVDDLKLWLFPKRKNALETRVALSKNKDWWLAQLHLYGIDEKPSKSKAYLIEALKSALSRGLKGPPKEILQLEQRLKCVFLLENAEAREKEYTTFSEENRAEKYSERYLREKFFNGTNDEKLVALEISTLGSCGRRGQLYRAATKLGLHSESAYGPQRRSWTIIGKNKHDVQERKAAFDKEFHDWELEESTAKQLKIEMQRQECEVGGEGSFKDVEGEWCIECPLMDKQYRKAITVVCPSSSTILVRTAIRTATMNVTLRTMAKLMRFVLPFCVPTSRWAS